MPSQTYVLPTSGWWLGRLLDGFRLRAPFDQCEQIKVRTARRYLQGEEGPRPETRDGAVVTFLALLLPKEVLPTSLPASELRTLAVQSLQSFLQSWDEVTGLVRSTTTPIERWDHGCLPWVRLLLQDVAVRTAAYLLLRGQALPSEEAWSEVACGRALRRAVESARQAGNYPREQLARDAGVAASTVDEWMAGRQLPQSESLENLAHALAAHTGRPAGHVALELRAVVAAADLVSFFRERLGHEDTHHIVRAFASSVAYFWHFVDGAALPPSRRELRLWQLLLGGALEPSSIHLFRSAAAETLDQELQLDLLALGEGRWGERIWGWYSEGDLRDPGRTQQRMREAMGLSAEEAQTVFENLVRHHLLPSVLQPASLEQMQFVRIEHDTSGKKANREQQWSWSSQKEDWAEALGHARRLVELEPTNAKYHLWLGTTLGKLHRVEEALEECRIAAALDPRWCLPAAEVGIVLLDHQRNDEAVQILAAIVAERPPRTRQEAAHLAYTHGVALMRTHCLTEATGQFRTTLEHNAEHALAMDLLAHCLLLQGERKEGREWAKRAAHRGQPESLQALDAGAYDRT
jgi:tetratricopeptide (TPR) repeat protein